jgi:hypothetical protein
MMAANAVDLLFKNVCRARKGTDITASLLADIWDRIVNHSSVTFGYVNFWCGRDTGLTINISSVPVAPKFEKYTALY